MQLIKHKVSWSALLVRGSAFAIIWWTLVDGQPHSWLIGAPTVITVTIVSVAVLAPTPLRWMQVPWFILFFFKRSLLGGLDVSRRALMPTLPLAPALIRYPLRTPEGLPRWITITTVSLLPGTLSADIQDDCLFVHVLDASTNFNAELEEVEQAIARLYGHYGKAKPQEAKG